jgi:transposase
MSQRIVRSILLDFYKIEISLGLVNKVLKQGSEALRPIYLEIQDFIKAGDKLHIDETSHPFKGKRLYLWVFRAPSLIYFTIGTRSKDTLVKVLGTGWEGIITCDFYTVYRSYYNDYHSVKLQFCLEHLKREFRHLSEYLDQPEVRIYGEKGVKFIQELIHEFNLSQKIEDQSSNEALLARAILSQLKEQLTSHAVKAPFNCPKAKAIAQRFIDYPDFYYTFLYYPGISPTNNAAEISIRGPVLARKISYGSQSISGIWFSETLWTIISTLKDRNEDDLEFLEKACKEIGRAHV